MSKSSDDSGLRASVWSKWLMVALIIYILPFVAIAIDEEVLKTFWFSHHLPDKVGDVLRAIYPFYRLFQ